MDDWETDMADSDFSVNLSNKLQELLQEVQKTCDDKLMGFNAKELGALKNMYGTTLTYALHKDIEFALSLPKASETVH
jgi:hypothetical protein